MRNPPLQWLPPVPPQPRFNLAASFPLRGFVSASAPRIGRGSRQVCAASDGELVPEGRLASHLDNKKQPLEFKDLP